MTMSGDEIVPQQAVLAQHRDRRSGVAIPASNLSPFAPSLRQVQVHSRPSTARSLILESNSTDTMSSACPTNVMKSD